MKLTCARMSARLSIERANWRPPPHHQGKYAGVASANRHAEILVGRRGMSLHRPIGDKCSARGVCVAITALLRVVAGDPANIAFSLAPSANHRLSPNRIKWRVNKSRAVGGAAGGFTRPKMEPRHRSAPAAIVVSAAEASRSAARNRSILRPECAAGKHRQHASNRIASCRRLLRGDDLDLVLSAYRRGETEKPAWQPGDARLGVSSLNTYRR